MAKLLRIPATPGCIDSQELKPILSAGLPGADWWVADAAMAVAEDTDVELDEVERFCTEHGLWPGIPSGLPARRALGVDVSERRDDLLCRRGGTVHASGGQGLRPYDPGCSGMRAPRRGHPPHTKGDQAWPTWSRSYVQWGAPPGPGGAGPVGLGLRDGKHAPRKICGTVPSRRFESVRPQSA